MNRHQRELPVPTTSFPTRRSSDLSERAALRVALIAAASCMTPPSTWARERSRSTTPLGLLTRSEEHTSELQSLMRISYAVFCLKKKNPTKLKPHNHNHNYSNKQYSATHNIIHIL